MIKRLFTGVFLGIMALGAAYLYFLYVGDPTILRTWIQSNFIYSVIFFVSFVLMYMLQGNNKIYKFLMFVIILINLFIIGDMFFKNNIGLNNQQFLTLFGLVVVALAVTYITHWVRFIFMSIVGVGIFFVLLTGILPMYETMPNIQDFISSQKTRILNKGVVGEGMITIKNALGSRNIPVNTLQENDIDLSQKTQISYASKTQTDTEKMFIDLGNGSFININPQSAITLEQSGGKAIMEILQGNVEYFIPSALSGTLQIKGKYGGTNIYNISNTVRSGLLRQFEQKKEDFFINQLGGSMILNPTVNKVIKFFITTLYTISPKTYEKNLNNFNDIQEYFSGILVKDTSAFTGEKINGIIDNIMSQVKKGAGETTIIKQLLNK